MRSPGAPAQRTLLVHLLSGPVPADWTADVVRVVGGRAGGPGPQPGAGRRGPTPRLPSSASPALRPPTRSTGSPRPTGSSCSRRCPTTTGGVRAFVVRTRSSGDWSTYTVRLVGPGGAGAPAGIDLPLSTAPFTFTVDCPSDLDCAPATEHPPEAADLLPGDYLARDYEALRSRLLDRLATLLPDWTDRNPADPAVMLVELFAALGDRLAYWQDAVAVEAYLGTARRRTSVRRHARLLDYTVHEGCSARTLLAFTTDSDLTLPRGTPVTDLPVQPGVELRSPLDAVEVGGTVFETAADLADQPGAQCPAPARLGRPDHCLQARGHRSLRQHPVGHRPRPARPATSSSSSTARSAAPPARATPRAASACASSRTRRAHTDPLDAVARGVGAALGGCRRAAGSTHGHHPGRRRRRPPSRSPTSSSPTTGPASSTSRSCRRRCSTRTTTGPDSSGRASAGSTGRCPRQRRPPSSLRAERAIGRSVARTLRRAAHVDPAAGPARQRPPRDPPRRRAGAGGRQPVALRRRRRAGARPCPGTTALATYRVGGGVAGNVAPDRLVRLLALADGRDPVGAGAVVSVWNPLPGTRRHRPRAARAGAPARPGRLPPAAACRRPRPTTPRSPSRTPGVQRAVARRRWSGSWYAQEVTVDPVAAHADDPALLPRIIAALEVRRMAGIDVELERPGLRRRSRSVSAAACCPGTCEPTSSNGSVRRSRRGCAATAAAASSTPTASPSASRSGCPTSSPPRWPSTVWPGSSSPASRAPGASALDAAASLEAGELTMAPRELLRCDSDVNNPEAGHIEIILGGGS